jgi:hypothetical protein
VRWKRLASSSSTTMAEVRDFVCATVRGGRRRKSERVALSDTVRIEGSLPLRARVAKGPQQVAFEMLTCMSLADYAISRGIWSAVLRLSLEASAAIAESRTYSSRARVSLSGCID